MTQGSDARPLGADEHYAAPWRPYVPTGVALVCVAASGIVAGALATSNTSELVIIAAIGTVAQLAAYRVLTRVVLRRGIAISSAVGLAWLVYFTMRLVITQQDRGNLNEHVAVREAGDWVFVWAWLLTTAAFWAFVLGVKISGVSRPVVKRRPDLAVRSLFVLAIAGLLGRYAMVFGGISSGFIENIMSLYLLAFGALGYHAVKDRSVRLPLYVLVAMASTVGVLISFKEAAVVPLAALTVGMAGAGVRVGAARITAIVAVGVVVFLTVQGGRVAYDVGDSVPIWRAPIAAVTDYNLESGTPGRPGRTADEAVWDVVQGMSRRFGGITSIMVLHERVPSEVDHLHGLSLWQPAASSVPILPNYVHLEFPQLSLGRYFTVTFIADDPDENLSSQAITVPGDLYLNFGWVGVVVGLALWGLAMGRLDRALPPTSATKIGAIVYLGHILIGVERNLAFLSVNAAIRVVVVFMLLRAVERWGVRDDAEIDLRDRQAFEPALVGGRA